MTHTDLTCQINYDQQGRQSKVILEREKEKTHKPHALGAMTNFKFVLVK